MSFFSSIWKGIKKVAPIAIGASLGGPLGIGAAAGGALGGAAGSLARGGNIGQVLQGVGYGYGAGSLAGGLSSAIGASGAKLAPGAAGPVTSGLGTAQVFGNAVAPGLTSSLTGGSGGGISGLFGSATSPGSLLSTGANLYSGIQGNQAVKEMTRAQQASNDKALALQSKMYDQTSANMSPFLTAGSSANSRLSDLLGVSANSGADGYGSLAEPFSIEKLQADPGYQFRLEQGTKAMNQSLGAKGSLFSGEALKAAQNFGQGLADQTYNDAYERYNADQGNQFNRLNTVSGSGQNAAANLGAAGNNYANQASDLYQNTGNITANGLVARNNNTNQSLANILGSNVGGFGGQNGYMFDPYTGQRLGGFY